MNYIGSKKTLLPWIDTTIKSVVGDISKCVFCDMFTGTAVVGMHFKNKVKKVIANDKEYYSYVLARNYIGNNKPIDYKSLFLNEITNTDSIDYIFDKTGKIYIKGFDSHSKIYQEYSVNRLYFLGYNATKIDTIRNNIEVYKDNPDVYFFLLASLLESADKVANTASVYASYLKSYKVSASKMMKFEPAEFELSKNTHEVYNEDANSLITKINGDILYLDPPYNEREYGAYYHLLNTIALYDDFEPKGVTGQRPYTKSNWCKKDKVYNELDTLIKNANFKYIFLSYNDEGLLSLDDIKTIFSQYGKYEVKSQNNRRYKADSKRVNKKDETIEYLHILIKE